MARLETWYRCACCHMCFPTLAAAREHALKRIVPEQWAVSETLHGKAVSTRIPGGVKRALELADRED